MLFVAITDICLACGSKCTACEIKSFDVASTVDKATCTGCIPGHFLSDGQCVSSCPDGSFIDPKDNMTCTGESLVPCLWPSTDHKSSLRLELRFLRGIRYNLPDLRKQPSCDCRRKVRDLMSGSCLQLFGQVHYLPSGLRDVLWFGVQPVLKLSV